jgi:hypothetical protein
VPQARPGAALELRQHREVMFGAGAVKSRFSRSDGRSWPAGPGTDVLGRSFLAAMPAIPGSRISRSTVHRATSIPSRTSSRQTFRALYAFRPFPDQIRMISFFISSSRADGFSSLLLAA